MSDTEYYVEDLNQVSVNVEKLISEVQKRPALYNKKLEESSNRFVKDALWAEVFANVTDDWKDLNEKEKAVRGKEIQRRWKNLKDCFVRECRSQHKGYLKKRKYVHFDSLSFLAPAIGYKLPNYIEIPPIDLPAPMDVPMKKLPIDIRYKEAPKPVIETVKNPPACSSCKELSSQEFERALLQILADEKKDEIDEDKNFAMMLVPMLKKLTDAQKHYAKVGILNVMNDARQYDPLNRNS